MARRPTLFARLPTRVRVALTFGGVMAVLLAAIGLFLYWQMGQSLNATVDQGLRSRAGDVRALVREADSGLAQAGHSPLTEQGAAFAQILDARRRVVDASPGLRNVPLLTPGEARRAARDTIVVEHPSSPIESDRVRLLATPVHAQGQRVIVVVGASLEPTEQARTRLGRLLLIGGPVALLIALLAGYGAATGALRPVELMGRRAREIQATRPGQRLPVPPSNDEVARLGATLNEMLERLEEAMAREREFVADASHELRTPLAILKGELELALREATDVEGFREAVTSAGEEADRLVQLAEDLLVIARSDQGRLPVRVAEVDATELLESARERFSRRAQARGVALEVRVPDGLRLWADSLRVEQAIGNLLDNALRHGGERIELVAVAADDGVAVHVRDDGPGFAPGFLDHAFERFTRADAARTGGGAGLGLAIVQAIAMAHGGDAHARNRPEGGADVWITLPRDGHS